MNTNGFLADEFFMHGTHWYSLLVTCSSSLSDRESRASELQYLKWTRSHSPINVTDENQKWLKEYFRKINLPTVHKIHGPKKQDYLL